ncbi:hypothetical protein [Actinomadura sp. NEAU-AAG7]|uniref:hypothetical protein n=1 Tax=Actinomadura sp. NEAU-AAG7 TaxID=2839640 RepID=UPI001BE3EEC8|nr:hypothetical protein [Actinomadura sp. NEAU-AAG7]MBT2213496.1 hypothetical protein [Actinomadura sp. NEAU-AAG7]
MVSEWGVWSDFAGGFIYGPCDSTRAAEAARDELIEQGEDSDDLRVRGLCPDHSDEAQPADACEECN